MLRRLSFVLLIAAVTVLSLSIVSAQPAPATGILANVLGRGVLNCGVNPGIAGFALQNPDTGRWEGLEADLCRAVAAAVFGPAYADDKVNYVPLTGDVRFTALANGEVDVLIRNSTRTLTRDITLGVDWGPTTFYDAQGLLVRIADGFNSLADMEGATFCTTSGTTTEKNITEAYLELFGALPTLVLGQTAADNLANFQSGACDVLTADKSQLWGIRSTADDPASLTVLPDVLSKEPLTPAYLHNDAQWGDIVDWTIYATIQAEEFNLTMANVDAVLTGAQGTIGADGVVDLVALNTVLRDNGVTGAPTAVLRFLGLTGDAFGDKLGIPNSFAADIVRTVGNYGELYARNIVPIGIAREGTPNDLWTRGGLMYAPPWR